MASCVQTGDLVDRGPNSLQVVQLMIKLHQQAAEAGGRVLQLLGTSTQLQPWPMLDTDMCTEPRNHEFGTRLAMCAPRRCGIIWWHEGRVMALGASASMAGRWLRFKPVVAVHAASSTVHVHGGLRTHVAALGVAKIIQLAQVHCLLAKSTLHDSLHWLWALNARVAVQACVAAGGHATHRQKRPHQANPPAISS